MMIHKCLGILASLFTLTVFTQATERVALIVGCGDYRGSYMDLATPTNDVKAMAGMLQSKMGFTTVIQASDVDLDGFYAKIEQFKKAANGAEVAFFYFSGHGVENGGQNYLLPTDAVLDQISQLRSQTVSLSTVLRDVKSAQAQASVVVLDCCRDNPLLATKSWAKTKSVGGTRELVLAQLGRAQTPDTTLIAFATSPGRKAAAVLRDDSIVSPYTESLLQHLTKPGVALRDAFENAHDALIDATDFRQIPQLHYQSSARILRQLVLVATTSGMPQNIVRPIPSTITAKPIIIPFVPVTQPENVVLESNFDAFSEGDIARELGYRLIVKQHAEGRGRRQNVIMGNDGFQEGEIRIQGFCVSGDFELEIYGALRGMDFGLVGTDQQIKVGSNLSGDFSFGARYLRAAERDSTLKIRAEGNAIKVFIGDKFINSEPYSGSVFDSLSIRSIGVSDFVSGYRLTTDGAKTKTLEKSPPPFATKVYELPLQKYQQGDLPSELGKNLTVSIEQGEKAITAHGKGASLVIPNVELNGDFELGIHGRLYRCGEIRLNGPLGPFVVDIDGYYNQLRFGGGSKELPNRDSLVRLRVTGRTARCYVNDELVGSEAIKQGSFNSIVIDELSVQDHILSVTVWK